MEVAAGRELWQLEGLELLQVQVQLVVHLDAAGSAVGQFLRSKAGLLSNNFPGAAAHHGEAGVLQLEDLLAAAAAGRAALFERVAHDELITALEHPRREAAHSVIEARSPQLRKERSKF